VVQGETLAAADLSSTEEIEAASGEMLPVTVEGGAVMIGDATVVEADIEAGDGIVHVVDRILLP
jgi:uncharacterized surface protein with fasciclin (FAS1) repeats